MVQTTYDLDVLRSFVAGVDLQSFAKAADRQGRSTSAISAQLKRLEQQAGVPLFRKAGRGLALTEAGEMLLSYARRLLDLNDEVVIAMLGAAAEGVLRIGLQHDFADSLLPKILGRFARAHPKVRIEAEIARNHELLKHVSEGDLDFALAWEDREAACPDGEAIGLLPMCWIGAGDGQAFAPGRDGEPVALVVYDDRCRFRQAAVCALDSVGRPWRIGLTSPNLSGIWAGVSAGLGITVRTAFALPTSVNALDGPLVGLPALPALNLAIYRSNSRLAPVAEQLIAIVKDEIGNASASITSA
ncbi:LysR substrate-binding domain-containing protein [Aestuariispira ectoiniformans]|uniref:LysR substrate-binding domain-containing protein n=1 Tax=Aestuariispira ectoiniformans TaxID=2775080 RepID=UPI00223BAF59|nr:LysR substrate-binding domain-containing protein [Aestuariispira ectoiniformans]